LSNVHYGLTHNQWGYLLAAIIFLGWPVLWRWQGKDWLRDVLAGFYKIFVSEDEYDVEQHEDVLDLQAKYFGVIVFWFMYIPIILIDLNLMGVLGTSETSQNIYIGGASLTLAGILGGSTIVSYLMTGAKLLLTGAFGLGNFVEGFHPHEDHFAGWVKKVELFSTTFLSPEFATLVIPNSVLLEYRIKNYDRSPFYHEIFEIPVNEDNKLDVVGSPPEFDNDGKIIRKGIESKLIKRIQQLMPNFIFKTSKGDRDFFESILPNLNWSTVSGPSCTLIDHNTAVLRFPVRKYLDGITLRHEISRRNILDTSGLKLGKQVKEFKEKQKELQENG
jgi:hypothetical protein